LSVGIPKRATKRPAKSLRDATHAALPECFAEYARKRRRPSSVPRKESLLFLGTASSTSIYITPKKMAHQVPKTLMVRGKT
jgi:hypothetical protein